MQKLALPALLNRYEAACAAYTETCIAHQDEWTLADVAEFTELFDLLVEYAKAGAADAQYAVASILYLGTRSRSQQEHLGSHALAVKDASVWWVAAARQGHLHALDNLLTCGVGEEAERVRRVAEQMKQERPELVTWTDGMPCLQPHYFVELAKRSYGISESSSGHD